MPQSRAKLQCICGYHYPLTRHYLLTYVSLELLPVRWIRSSQIRGWLLLPTPFCNREYISSIYNNKFCYLFNRLRWIDHNKRESRQVSNALLEMAGRQNTAKGGISALDFGCCLMAHLAFDKSYWSVNTLQIVWHLAAWTVT